MTGTKNNVHFTVATITVYWDVQKSSPNRKSLNWRVNAAIASKAKRAGIDGWYAAGRPRSGVPVKVDVTIFRGRRIDAANAWAALKHVMDGIFVKALTPDDGEKWVRLGTLHQDTGDKHKGLETVVFQVTPA
jgi:hypothetical protein